jgi:hypothetical protein
MPKSKRRKKVERKSAEETARIAAAKSARRPFRPAYLIQRVEVYDEPIVQKTGVDRLFGFDYMGSAEFEFGALPKALREMRAAPDICRDPVRIKLSSLDPVWSGEVSSLWYVGVESEEVLGWAKSLIVDQLGPRTFMLKERTKMASSLNGETGYSIPDGWWAIDQDPPWALFTKKEYANLWLGAM